MTSLQKRKMNEAYFETKFLLGHGCIPLPNEFHIITAWNPMDHLLPLEENLARNEKLRSLIEQSAYTAMEITGISPDQSHQEPSFLTDANSTKCLQWARKFDQRAIYRVAQDQLEILSCSDSGNTYALGSFSQRVSIPHITSIAKTDTKGGT